MTNSEIIVSLAQQIVALEKTFNMHVDQGHRTEDHNNQLKGQLLEAQRRINDLENGILTRDKRVAEHEAIALSFKGQLDDIDGILGNCAAFERCNGRQDKIRLAMKVASRVDPLDAKVERLENQLKDIADHRNTLLKSYTEAHEALEKAGVRNAQNLMEVTDVADRVRMLAADRDAWKKEAEAVREGLAARVQEVAKLRDDLAEREEAYMQLATRLDKAIEATERNEVWVDVTKCKYPFFHGGYNVRLRDGCEVLAESSNKGWKPIADNDVTAWACTEEDVCSLIDDLGAAHRKLEKYRPLVSDWTIFEGVGADANAKWTYKGILESTIEVFSEPGETTTVKEVTDYIKACLDNLYDERKRK